MKTAGDYPGIHHCQKLKTVMQKALDISYSKQFGTLNLEELNNYLSQGWCVVSTEASTGGDILVIIQEPPQQAAPQ